MSFTRYRSLGGRLRTWRDMRFWREAAAALIAVSTLAAAPLLTAQAADDELSPHSLSAHAHATGEAVKQDSKAVGAAFREGAHRVAVAAKAVGHEVATAARRGAEKTRAAFKAGTPS
jgi:predicted alpha/beta hydrolase